ncbi:hypothetical protein IWW45_000229 [Coemansia sp. RSA 485]|nr:hypothetical protein IWW45_000229 [Coemansia sp. RSA 485]
MIAPEGIRDGRYYAEALYTFAGEGVEDLPFKKGDLIEVLDCADANWWRGKILGTDEDGLFPACLVKFTEAPAAQEAMKTAERLARLSDVLTPSHIKQQQQKNENSGANGGSDPSTNDANSIESLLLNLANNEMQVQQQKIQAHMPQKPTRMKLLYEDHTRPDSAASTSAATNQNENTQTKPISRPPLPKQNLQGKQMPVPQTKKQPQNKNNNSADMSLSQIGIWTPRNNPPPAIVNYSNSSFTSSIESMRDVTLRTEASTQNRSSGSMLFGPRGMPSQPGSRSSSRINDSSMRSANSTLRSPFTTVSSHDAFSQGGSQSFASLYSQSDSANTMARNARAAHEAAISEARQMLDGIPSPIDPNNSGRHEAEYLFDDDCAEDNEDEYGSSTEINKLNSMISPASENSAKFNYYGSTVSSRVSSIAESTTSKRLPAIPSTANASMVSDTSGTGLAGPNSSVGDFTHLHRSWYSSSDSLDLLGGGGGGLRSATIDEAHADEDGGQADQYAPRMAKNKSRIRPVSDTITKSMLDSGTISSNPADSTGETQYSGNFDTQHNIASDFQRMLNLSATTQNMYSSTVDMQSTMGPSSVQTMLSQHQSQYQQQLQQQQHPQQSQQPYPQQMYAVISNPQQGTLNRYPSVNGYAVPAQAVYANGMSQQGYASPVYSGVDANGRPYSAYSYQQPSPQPYSPHHQQQIASAMQGGIQMIPNVQINGSAQASYYDPNAQAYIQPQSQPQQYLSSYQTTAAAPVSASAVHAVPVVAEFANRPRSNTAGPTATHSPSTPSQPAIAANGVPRQSNLRPVSSANGLQTSNGVDLPVPNKQEQFGSDNANGIQRPASYSGPSTLSNANGRPASTMTPDSGFPARASTPTGFGTLSSTPPATFARREGSMSPFPSNIGPTQPGTYSASTPMDMPKDMFIENIDPQLKQRLPENVTPINFVKMTRPVFKFGGHISHPESVSWSKIDRQMAMIKSISVKLTADVLATMHVGRPFNKPIERVRAAFTWIATNIQYDTSAAESTEEFEQQEAPNAVLLRRRSRGPGFAYLFTAMMDALGIESITISGYLRQPLDSYQGPVLPAANHVWNAVCLDGEYRLIDTACAAKSHPLNAESRIDSWFFLASPKDLIFTHFPTTPGEQFVDPVVPLPVFWMLPYVRPSYFSCKLKLLNLPHVPRIELRDDAVTPLVLCVRDSTMSVFAEVELHDPNGSGRIVARQPLLAQCMDYRGKRMVKILVGVRAGDTRGLIKIYCGTRLALQPKRLGDETPSSPGKAHKVLGFLHNKDKRPSAHDYTRIKDVDEEGRIKTAATYKTYPLACILPVVHRGRNNAQTFVQLNAAIPNEFYIKEPTDGQFHLGESVNFHLLPVGEERLFHLQLRSPSGQQYKFVYQPADQGYILRHPVKERGAWIIVYHTDTDGWLPIASYNCV